MIDMHGKYHSANFTLGDFDVGTDTALKLSHSRFRVEDKPSLESGVLIVL